MTTLLDWLKSMVALLGPTDTTGARSEYGSANNGAVSPAAGLPEIVEEPVFTIVPAARTCAIVTIFEEPVTDTAGAAFEFA
jgi:hypothetical protein